MRDPPVGLKHTQRRRLGKFKKKSRNSRERMALTEADNDAFAEVTSIFNFLNPQLSGLFFLHMCWLDSNLHLGSFHVGPVVVIWPVEQCSKPLLVDDLFTDSQSTGNPTTRNCDLDPCKPWRLGLIMKWDTAQEFNSLLLTYPYNARSILHGYFNPLVFWYWEYLRSPAKSLSFFARYLADWQCSYHPLFGNIPYHPIIHHKKNH